MGKRTHIVLDNDVTVAISEIKRIEPLRVNGETKEGFTQMLLCDGWHIINTSYETVVNMVMGTY
ncbi:hypothetical protein [Culicoidibacter larvae]|uniref:Uncharacterized protein n=1 Tax=Culicoidibacter larvae TaxID=2579976 RepID=A0A5R8QB20_9FIRM|nr:hypothetical protein [Culicoidibacter larvae]TLG72090.1 hypothetical protein FEZ08_09665 [Culicoidibacter larvae]